MTPTAYPPFRALLQAELDRLQSRTLTREEMSVSDERESDQLCNAAQFQHRELVGELETRRTAKIRQIEAALERMERNEYGICEDCGEPIPLKRLNAVPWATVCVPCQELRDREEVRDAA